VPSPGSYFPVGENCRHSRGLGWRAPVSGRQFLAFPPVSARFFPISVSGEGRLVRLLPETGSGLTAAWGQQPRSALLSKSYFGWLDGGSRETVGRIASSHWIPCGGLQESSRVGSSICALVPAQEGYDEHKRWASWPTIAHAPADCLLTCQCQEVY
jgi:hypothetical protein